MSGDEGIARDVAEARGWTGLHCELVIERPARGVVVLRISGHDVGEFGSAPMQELERLLSDGEPLELFIDARNSEAVSLEVSAEWAQWLGRHRPRCAQIRMLSGSRFIQITADFVRRFADLGDTMRIYTDAAAFDRLLESSIVQAKAKRPS